MVYPVEAVNYRNVTKGIIFICFSITEKVNRILVLSSLYTIPCSKPFNLALTNLTLICFPFTLLWMLPRIWSLKCYIRRIRNITLKLYLAVFIKIFQAFGREPWSCGYGRRLVFRKFRVRIPIPYTGWW